MVAVDMEFDCVKRRKNPENRQYPELLQFYTEYEKENKSLFLFCFFIKKEILSKILNSF